MSADPLERIIAALQAHGCRPKRVRDGVWRAHSPLREDKKPSLIITDKGDQILMYDHGGGRTADVLKDLNLAIADLFRTSAAGPLRSSIRRRRVAVYPYEDSAGELLAAKSRFEPKEFRWRRPSDEIRSWWRDRSGAASRRRADSHAVRRRSTDGPTSRHSRGTPTRTNIPDSGSSTPSSACAMKWSVGRPSR